ncbi:MAG: DUF2264 domain-containing protein [Propionibacteriaceae bacterium]|nr:DUF2264 domain-containing protein [Propionibacteriaceae bacterium]
MAVVTPEQHNDATRWAGISPWGKAEWEGFADDLLDGVAPYRSPAGASYDLPGGPARAGWRSDGLEGFARTFILAAFRVAGAAVDALDPMAWEPAGALVERLDAYRVGLVAGVTPTSPEAWPPIRSVGPGGQAMVEAAAISLGLRITKPWLWDRLDDAERDAVEGWLRGAVRGEPASNNWYLFPLTVAGFLESVGRGDAETRAAIDRAFTLLDGWYEGEGWYRDGDARSFDHYNSWTFHFLPWLFLDAPGDCGLTDTETNERRAVIRERLRDFLDSYLDLFDHETGSPLYFGRSLTYRWACLAAVAAGCLADAMPRPWGEARALLERTGRYFLEHGALDDGVMTRGWHGPHAATLQIYSGPASPYWASKAFALLLVPRDHPLWAGEKDDPAPADASPASVIDETGDPSADVSSGAGTGGPSPLIRPLAAAGWLIHRTEDGIARVHNHGSDDLDPAGSEDGPADPLYARYAYATRTGPTSVRNLSDNDITIVWRGVPSARRRIDPRGCGEDWAASRQRLRFPVPIAIREASPARPPDLPLSYLDAITVARGAWEVRLFRFTGVPEGLEVRCSGWALAADRPGDISVETIAVPGAAFPASNETLVEPHQNLSSRDAVSSSPALPWPVIDPVFTVESGLGVGFPSPYEREDGKPTPGVALAAEGLRADLVPLNGWTDAVVDRAPQGTAYGRYALIPVLVGRSGPAWFAAAARLTADVVSSAEPPRLVGVSVDGVVIEWHDGEHTISWTGDVPAVTWSSHDGGSLS